MDIREQQEATSLSTALRGGQEQQAHDYLLNVVLQEPHALQIIKSANEQAGAQRLDSVGVYQPSGRVVLVPSTETGRQTEVGRLSPQQLSTRESDAREYAPPVVAAPVAPPVSEGDALGAALKTGDSTQVQSIMQNVVQEPNALNIIQRANSVAGQNPAENIGVNQDNSVVLITNADGKQYSLGSLAQVDGAPVAPAAPQVSEADALGAALKAGDSTQVQTIMQNVVQEANALSIIKHANSVAGTAPEYIGVNPDHSVVLVSDANVVMKYSDGTPVTFGSLTQQQLEGRVAAPAPVPVDVQPAPRAYAPAAPAPTYYETAPPPPQIGIGIGVPFGGGYRHHGYYGHQGWGPPRPGIGIGLGLGALIGGALAGASQPRY